MHLMRKNIHHCLDHGVSKHKGILNPWEPYYSIKTRHRDYKKRKTSYGHAETVCTDINTIQLSHRTVCRKTLKKLKPQHSTKIYRLCLLKIKTNKTDSKRSCLNCAKNESIYRPSTGPEGSPIQTLPTHADPHSPHLRGCAPLARVQGPTLHLTPLPSSAPKVQYKLVEEENAPAGVAGEGSRRAVGWRKRLQFVNEKASPGAGPAKRLAMLAGFRAGS